MIKVILIFLLMFVIGCSEKIPESVFCEKDYDCACGTHVQSGDCFYGNRDFVYDEQCPDFCSGINGKFELKCINNSCHQLIP